MRIGLIATVAAFVLLALLYASTVPAYETPDECAHTATVWQYAAHGYAPYDAPVTIAGDGHRVFEGHQPPLHYAVAALGVKLFRLSAPLPGEPRANGDGGTFLYVHERTGFAASDARSHPVFWPRLVSIAFGAVACAFAFLLGETIFPSWRHGGLATALATCFVPQVIATSGSASNDAAALAIGTATLLWTARCLRRNEVSANASLVLGLLAGLAVLTKLNCLPVFIAPLVALVRCRPPLRRVAGAAAVALLVAAWFPLRNWMEFRDPLLWKLQAARLPHILNPPPAWYWWPGRFATLTYRSYWGLFGWMNVPMSGGYYLATGVLLAAAVAGIVVALREKLAFERLTVAAGIVAFACTFLALVHYNQGGYLQPQGRLLFPAAAGLGMAIALGVHGSTTRLRDAGVWTLAIALLAMNAACLGVLAG